MNLNYITVFILLLITLISVSIIVYQINNNLRKNELLQYNSSLLKLINNKNDIQEHFEDDIETHITGITVSGEGKQKIIVVEGKKLTNIKDVFFGDIKGTIKNNSTNIKLNIIPPDFIEKKYEGYLAEISKGLEIKLLLEHGKIVPVTIADESFTYNKDNTPKVIELTKKINGKALISFTASFEEKCSVPVPSPCPADKIVDETKVTIQINEKEEDIYDTKLNTFNVELKGDIKITLISDNIEKLNLTDIKVTDLSNYVSILIPTGLYFKIKYNTVTAGTKGIEYNSGQWSLILKDKMDKSIDNTIKEFYQKSKDSLITTELPPAPEIDTDDYNVQNLSITVDDTERMVVFSWDTPPSLIEEADLDNYYYYMSCKPNDDSNSKNIIEQPQIPVLIEDLDQKTTTSNNYNNNFRFPKDKLVPGKEYKYQVRTIKRSSGLEQGRTEKLETYNPGNKYHTHLYDPVTKKFDLTEIEDLSTSDNEELVKSYYQMLAYNKMQSEEDLRISQLDLGDSAKCVQGNVNEFIYGDLGNNFRSKVNTMVNENSFKEGNEFDEKQRTQNEQISDIEKKLEEVESHHKKKTELQDLSIKTLKSLQDGSLIRLEELNGEKRLVMLNEGCLAFDKNNQFGKKDDYGYMPCNMFDGEQHFVLNKINNLDEYNFLLSSNLKPTIREENDNKFNYPFYTLQPQGSSKCVTVDNGKLQIKPCSDDKTIKYTGYFDSNQCNV